MPKGDETKRDYEILGLENSATEEDARRSFMKLALKFHPDLHTRPHSDEVSKSKYHEVCQAFARIMTGDRTVSEWNSDKSDEIFFSLLREILQATLKSGSLYSLFSSLPNHKTNFKDDNEYRCQEDALDDESEETDFNKLLDILKNRLQNGKSVPIGLTKEKIFKLKEEFAKQKEANKKLAAEKGAAACKKPNKTSQVPVTKPKPKTKKQLLAEQRRREKEMAKIAAELEEKKKKESEKDNMKKQLEAEKQRKLDEELKRQEEERKKEFQEAKKKREKEEKEKEARLQKERDRQEKLRKQQEEEQRRKEEEKKRKAEEKAAKAKSLKEAKDKEEKEKAEQAKKAQQAKRQQQYQQYQQQQQKYPREVPPRFLRQQQLKQQQGVPQSQEALVDTTTKQGAKKKDTSDFSVGKVSSVSDSKSGMHDFPASSWSEPDSGSGELWGEEVSKDNETESSWGGIPVTEDWDAPPIDRLGKETSTGIYGFSELASSTRIGEDAKITEPSPIGSELKQGKIQKRDCIDKVTDMSVPSAAARPGGFGAVGERLGTVTQTTTGNKSSGMDNSSERAHSGLFEYSQASSDEVCKLSVVDSVSNTLESNSSDNVSSGIWNKAPGRPKNSVQPSVISSNQVSSGPKLTDWSGLDAFEPIPSGPPSSELIGKKVGNTVAKDTKGPVNTGTNAGDRSGQSKQVHTNTQAHSNSHEEFLHKGTVESAKDRGLVSISNEQHLKASVSDSLEQLPTFDVPQSVNGPKVKTSTAVCGAGGEDEDEYGWTTASRKAKKNAPSSTSSNKDSNAWVNRSLNQLLDMGFQREDAERALRENNGIIESAVSDLLAGVDKKPKEAITTTQSVSVEKTSSTKVFGTDQAPANVSTAQATTTTGQPKLNRKQRRKLMQQQEQLNAQSNDSNEDGEWKLVTRERNTHSTNHTTTVSSDVASTKTAPKSDQSIRPAASVNSRVDVSRPNNPAIGGKPSVKTSTVPPGAATFKASMGSELSKSLPVLSDSFQAKVPGDSGQVNNQSTSCSASPRSSGSQSPSLNYHSQLLQSNLLNNLPFKSLSSDPLQQSMNSSSAISSASHLFYSDPQLLQEQASGQGGQQRNANQGLLKGTPSSTASSIGSQNGGGNPPLLQSSLMQHILLPQSSVVNTVVGKPSDPVKSDYSLSTDPLTKTMKHMGQDTNTIPSLTRQQTPGAPPPFPNPLLFANAPQQSKLHQWKQPIQADGRNVQELNDSTNRMHPSSNSVGDFVLPSVPGAVTAPVTVDPVSAKWGVVAAPRLSPTPSEFKPGVPWKPRSEMEKEAREKSLDGDKELSSTSTSNSEALLTTDSSHSENNVVTCDSSTLASDSKAASSMDSPFSQSNDSIRPPPGLSDSYAFQNLPARTVGNSMKKEPPVDESPQPANWIILKGFNDKVDLSSLKSLCQKYGLVLDFQVGSNCICIHFETVKQATDACKVFNGKRIFDSHFTAEVASGEKILALLPGKSWSRTSDSSTPPVDPLVNINQRMPGIWVAPTQLNPDPTCVMGPSGLGGPIPVNMFGMAPPITQWSGIATDPTRPTGPFWPLQPGPFIPQVPLGPINLPAQPVTGTGTVVSPSMTKFLPDGLFNGSEST